MELIREIDDDISVKGLKDVMKYLDEFKNQDREFLIVMGLDTNNKPCYREVVAIGTLNTSLVHPREIFKKAIIMSSNSIIVAHNHPSGNIALSIEDGKVMDRLKECGDLLDIKLLDFIIFSKDKYESYT